MERNPVDQKIWTPHGSGWDRFCTRSFSSLFVSVSSQDTDIMVKAAAAWAGLASACLGLGLAGPEPGLGWPGSGFL